MNPLKWSKKAWIGRLLAFSVFAAVIAVIIMFLSGEFHVPAEMGWKCDGTQPPAPPYRPDDVDFFSPEYWEYHKSPEYLEYVEKLQAYRRNHCVLEVVADAYLDIEAVTEEVARTFALVFVGFALGTGGIYGGVLLVRLHRAWSREQLIVWLVLTVIGGVLGWALRGFDDYESGWFFMGAGVAAGLYYAWRLSHPNPE